MLWWCPLCYGGVYVCVLHVLCARCVCGVCMVCVVCGVCTVCVACGVFDAHFQYKSHVDQEVNTLFVIIFYNFSHVPSLVT